MSLNELGKDSRAIVEKLTGDERFMSRITSIGVISALFTGGNISSAFNAAMNGAGAASNLNEILLSNVSKAEA